jgi:hypothetical protein
MSDEKDKKKPTKVYLKDLKLKDFNITVVGGDEPGSVKVLLDLEFEPRKKS